MILLPEWNRARSSTVGSHTDAWQWPGRREREKDEWARMRDMDSYLPKLYAGVVLVRWVRWGSREGNKTVGSSPYSLLEKERREKRERSLLFFMFLTSLGSVVVSCQNTSVFVNIPSSLSRKKENLGDYWKKDIDGDDRHPTCSSSLFLPHTHRTHTHTHAHTPHTHHSPFQLDWYPARQPKVTNKDTHYIMIYFMIWFRRQWRRAIQW